MRTKFKAWTVPYLSEHPEVMLFVDQIPEIKDVYLEIGSGKGMFLVNMAKKFPDRKFIGIERNVTCAGYIAKKLVDEEIDNAKLIYVDASREIVNFKDKSINRIYLNFSDPWPKTRHHKRRLTSDNFLPEYRRILKDDGLIIFKTDNLDLFNDSIENFTNNNFVIKSKDMNYDGKDEEDTATEYESSFRGKGQPIYRLIISK